MSRARQSLPPSARSYAEAQRTEQAAALSAVTRQWSRMDDDFDASWARLAPSIIAIVLTAQARVAARGDLYIPTVLRETGQPAVASAVTNVDAFVGVTGAGVPVEASLAAAPIRAKQNTQGRWIEELDHDGETVTSRRWQPGMATPMALAAAGQWLTASIGTVLSDTARGAESVTMQTHNVDGWVRALNPPSCQRCVILAGKWFRINQGFERHPGCDCHHIPAAEGIAGDLTLDPNAYFESLDDAGRLKLAGSRANLRALEDGADLNQVVNAYRRTDGMRVAQVPAIERKHGLKFTESGSTDRSWFQQQQVGRGVRTPSPLGRAGAQRRLMPESIYANTSTRAEALDMLRDNGWILDPRERATGRTVIAEQTRAARNARRAQRRQARRLERLDELAAGLR